MSWLSTVYIPATLRHGALREPRLARVLTEEEAEGISLSLQFEADDNSSIESWRKTCGTTLHTLLQKKFGTQVLGFSTLLESIELSWK